MGRRAVASFDGIGPFYDFLASVAFMGRIRKSQRYFLKRLPPAKSVLVLGGGSGWILEDIVRDIKPITICYVEASAWMLQKARSRQVASEVTYIHGTENEVPGDQPFDLVITNFFLDMFDENGVSSVAERVHDHLSTNGVWMVTDFTCRNTFHRALLYIMYRFFSITTGLQQRSLSAWYNTVSGSGFRCTQEASFFGGFIRACVFKRR
jgi:tRNA (cmo5U34)-methyltransferase